MSQPTHPHHTVAPSAWPAMTAAGGLLVASGALIAMALTLPQAGLGLLLILPGLALVGYALYGWRMDMLREGDHEGPHVPPARPALRRAMSLFIWADVMFFGAFFAAYFNASLPPAGAIEFAWPPPEIDAPDPFALPWFNTLLLLNSVFALSWAGHDLRAGRINPSAAKLAAAIVLGALFVLILAFDVSRAGFSLADGIYATNYFVMAAVIGFHAMVGVGILTVSWLRLARGHFAPGRHAAFDAAAQFWRFVVMVWLLVFVSVFLWGSV